MPWKKIETEMGVKERVGGKDDRDSILVRRSKLS